MSKPLARVGKYFTTRVVEKKGHFADLKYSIYHDEIFWIGHEGDPAWLAAVLEITVHGPSRPEQEPYLTYPSTTIRDPDLVAILADTLMRASEDLTTLRGRKS